jgi:hypothetical protein
MLYAHGMLNYDKCVTYQGARCEKPQLQLKYNISRTYILYTYVYFTTTFLIVSVIFSTMFYI